MAPPRVLIPVRVDWQKLVGELYQHYYSYKRLLDALSKYGVYPDYSTLALLRSGRTKAPTWEFGAALLNLHEAIRE